MGQTLGNLKNSMPGGGGTNVADPGQSWGNMDSSQRGAAVIGGVGKGFGAGMQNYQQQNAGLRQPGSPAMSGMASEGAQQPVDPSYFAPGGNPFQPKKTGPNNLNFYGGGS